MYPGWPPKRRDGIPKNRHKLRRSPTILDENVGAQFIEPVSTNGTKKTLDFFYKDGKRGQRFYNH